MKNIRLFSSDFFFFLWGGGGGGGGGRGRGRWWGVVKFSVYLNRYVFVMN